MKRNIIAVLSLVVAMMILLTATVGCGTSKPAEDADSRQPDTKKQGEEDADRSTEKEPITFQMIMGSWPLWDEGMDADPVGQWITEQTGVTLDIELIAGELDEKYSLMLATGEYPELMAYSEAPMQSYINEGALLSYDDYLDSIPNVVSKYGDSLNALRNLADGKLYRLSQWFMGSYVLVDRAMVVRDDLMYAEFGDAMREKHTFTLEEIEQFFRTYKEENPVTEDGNEVFPLTDFSSQLRGYGPQMFGITPYYEISETQIAPDFLHPDFITMVTWFNQLYRDGLLDPEFAINKLENAQNKLSNGSSIALMCHHADVAEVNKNLEATDPNQFLQSYIRVDATGGKDAYLAMASIGMGGLSVTKNCKDVARAMEFIDFLSEPLTTFVLANGLEGGIWEYDEAGDVVILQDKVDAIPDLWDRFREYGAYKYTFMMHEGVDERFAGFDGLISDPIHGTYGVSPKEVEGRRLHWEDNDLVNRALYTGLSLEAGSPEALISQKINDILAKAFPQMVLASSEEEAIELYERAIEEVEQEGLNELMEAYSKQYFQLKELMELK